MKQTLQALLFLVLVPIALFVGGCGGGGGGAGTVSGVAAAGAPLAGTVTLKDSSSPAKEVSTALEVDGSFAIDIAGLTAPFIVKATGTAGGTNQTLYSFAGGAGIANVNPFSSFAVAVASGRGDLSTLYATLDASTLRGIAAKISSAVTDVQTKLQLLLAVYEAANINPMTDSFKANHTGLDEVLDMVSIVINGDTVAVRNRGTGGIIFTCQPNAINDGALEPSNIPAAPVRAVVSPLVTTVVVNKSTTFKAEVLRSTEKTVIWSVVESNGGNITSEGVYTAPSQEGIYHVKAVSVADQTWPAFAVVKVVAGEITVTIDPASATVSAGATKTFTSNVTGSGNSAVTWSVVESGGGSITDAGVYTAPTAAGTYHIKAVSAADTTKSAMATVSVPSAPKLADFPIGTWVGPNGASFTINKLDHAGLHANYYSGSITLPEGAGTVSVSGNEVPGDVSLIILGAHLGVATSIMTSSSATFYDLEFDGVTNYDAGRTDIVGLWGTMIMTTTSGNNISERVYFARQ